MRYCIKCFDSNDVNVITMVVDDSCLFEAVQNFRKDYKVKAYLLSEESEDIR